MAAIAIITADPARATGHEPKTEARDREILSHCDNSAFTGSSPFADAGNGPAAAPPNLPTTTVANHTGGAPGSAAKTRPRHELPPTARPPATLVEEDHTPWHSRLRRDARGETDGVTRDSVADLEV